MGTHCPACGAAVSPDDFQCGRCELLLNPDAQQPIDAPDSSVVRAMLSMPQNMMARGVPSPDPIAGTDGAVPPSVPGDEDTTAKFNATVEEQSVPKLVRGIDLALKPMHPFEAYVTSFLDGTTSVHSIAAAAALGDIEVRAVVRTLLERGIVELTQKPPPVRSPHATVPPVAEVEPAYASRPPAQVPPPRPTAPPLPPPPRAPASVLIPSAPVFPTPAPIPLSPPGAARPRLTPAPVPPSEAAKAAMLAARLKLMQRTGPMPVARPSPPKTMPPLEEGQASILQRAVAHERAGDPEGAIEVLKIGISQTTKPAPLYNRLALVLVNQRRDYRQAEELLRTALDLDPNNTVYEQNLFKILARAATDTHREKKGLLGKLTGKS